MTKQSYEIIRKATDEETEQFVTNAEYMCAEYEVAPGDDPVRAFLKYIDECRERWGSWPHERRMFIEAAQRISGTRMAVCIIDGNVVRNARKKRAK